MTNLLDHFTTTLAAHEAHTRAQSLVVAEVHIADLLAQSCQEERGAGAVYGDAKERSCLYQPRCRQRSSWSTMSRMCDISSAAS